MAGFAAAVERDQARRRSTIQLLLSLFVMATSSRSTESIYAQRKRQRQANFLNGQARSAHKLPQSLEDSFSTAQTNNGSTHEPPSSCKRGCPQILSGLKAAFGAVGHHPAKSHHQRLASYPLPKKQKIAHRNINGKNSNKINHY